jgi:hypothetical protein
LGTGKQEQKSRLLPVDPDGKSRGHQRTAMRDRKIYSLLALMGEAEQQRFSEYLVSPLFEPSPTLQRFFRLWREKILSQEAGDPHEFGPEEFLKGSRLIPSRIDKYSSALYKKAVDFLAMEQYLKSESRQIEFATDALEQRDAPRKEWEAQRERLQEDILSRGDSSDKYLRLLNFKWKDTEARVHTRETQGIWQEDFRGLHLAIDRYYCLQKLKLECAAANARMIYNQPRDEDGNPGARGLPFLPEWDMGEARTQLDPLSFSYWVTLRLYHSEDGTEEFEVLFAHLRECGKQFDARETPDIYSYLLNYCLRRANKGEVRYQQYSAALYRELLENEILLDEGKLAPQVMKNIVVINCVVGELEWVAGFLDAFENLLTGDPDPNIIKYNRAVLAFYQKDRHCIRLFKELISQLKDDVFYELDSRIYLLKAYFEHLAQLSLEEIDDMYRMYDSVRIFISRNEMVSPMHKQRYRNFITELRRFLKLLEANPQSPEPARLRKLYQKVDAAEFMVNKSWLLEKIEFFLKPA